MYEVWTEKDLILALISGCFHPTHTTRFSRFLPLFSLLFWGIINKSVGWFHPTTHEEHFGGSQNDAWLVSSKFASTFKEFGWLAKICH